MSEQSTSKGIVMDYALTKIRDKVNVVVGEKKEDALTWKEHFYNSAAVCAIATSVAAIFLEGSMIVTIVGTLCSFLGGAAAIKQSKISEIESLREIQNDLNEEVNFFRGEVKSLKAQNKLLEENTKKLQKTANAFQEITKDQGKSVEEMVAQLDEMREIQKEIKENLNAQIIQNVITVALAADRNNNGKIDEKEMNQLIFRLKAGLENLEGVSLHEKNFRKVMMKHGCSIQATIDIITNFLDDDLSNEENIFIEEKNARPKRKRR